MADPRQIDRHGRERGRAPLPALADALQSVSAHSVARSERLRRRIGGRTVERQRDAAALGRRADDQLERHAIEWIPDEVLGQMEYRTRSSEGQPLPVAFQVNLEQ